MKRVFPLAIAAVLALTACGDGSSVAAADAASTTSSLPPSSTVASTTSTSSTTSTTTSTSTSTSTTTTTTEAPAIVPGEDADVDAIVLAYTVALDSVSTYAEKAPYIEDPSGLEATVEKYVATGESMGGIGVRPTSVTIDGDTAVVTYDLLFAGNPSYPDLKGSAVKVDGAWKITRADFCSLMSSARVGCP